MDRALEHGINFFDRQRIRLETREGVTEQIIGRWFAQGGGRRDKVVLATKAWKMGEWPNERGLSARHPIQACEESLRRLQTDWIDLYQMHHVDRNTPWEEIWQAMEVLVTQGKVRYVGSSNFAGWHLVQAQEAAHRRHFLGLVSEQCIYNLLTRHVELEVLPAAQAYGSASFPVPAARWARRGDPQAGRRVGPPAPPPAGPKRRCVSTGRPSRRTESLCAELGHDPADMGVAWRWRCSPR